MSDVAARPAAQALPPTATATARALPLAALAVAAALAAAVAGPGLVRLGLAAVAATLAALAVLLHLSALAARRRRAALAAQVHSLLAEDAAPCLVTDPDGQLLWRNRAAEGRFDRALHDTLPAALGDLFAHPGAVLYRLQARAARGGAAREDVVTRRGHVRLSVHRLDGAGFLWRFEEMLDRAGPGARGAEGISLPMLVAGRGGTILFMNEALRRLVGGRPRTLDRVFAGPPPRAGETAVIAGADGPVRARVAAVEGAGGRREIFLLPEPLDAPPPQATEEDLPVALVRLTGDGRVVSANRRARDMLALGAGAAAALPDLPDLLDGPGRPLADWIADTAAGRLPPRPEVMRLRRPGEQRFVQVVPWRAPDGALSAVLTDATEIKTLEAQFIQSQKMQAIGQLAGGVAHDFNNLLTAISGHCDLLLLRRDPADPDWADLMQIHANANRAAALVAHLLAFSRKQVMVPERLDLADVLGDVTHLLRRLVGDRVALDLVPPGPIAPIRADRRQIEQVLVNLVVNARDAMPGGGTIRVAAAERRIDAPLTRGQATVPPGTYAVVTVADTGTGIPPELQDRIFEPFFTTKPVGEGTGLGLSTVYGIVKQSGGFVFVDSVPGEGATFAVWLPVHPDPAPAYEGALPAAADPAPDLPEWLDALLRRSGVPEIGRKPAVGSAALALGGDPDEGWADAVADAGVSGDAPPLATVDAGADAGADAARHGDAAAQVAAAQLAAADGADCASADVDAAAADDVPGRHGPVRDLPLAVDPAGPEAACAPAAPRRAGIRACGAPDAAAGTAEPRGAAGGAAAPSDAPARQRLPDAAAGPRRAVVLLVEDEAPVRAFASRALRLRGHTVIEAENGEQALRALDDPSLAVDVFVTDVMMQGLDGPTWVRRALAARPDARVVFVSGYTEEMLPAGHKAIPDAVFLAKPFSLDALTATVQRQLH